MDATVLLKQTEIESIARSMVPLRIDLSSEEEGKRIIDIDAIHSFTLAPNRGVRTTGKVSVEWPVLGINVPISVEDLTMEILITLHGHGDEARLCFQFRIEDADIKNVPGFLETPIIAKVNDALANDSTILSWKMGKTLRTDLPLPSLLQPQRAFHTRITKAGLAISAEALTVAVELAASVA